jgi:hypothetical protein
MASVFTGLDIEMDMDEIWSETLQNFQQCNNEKETTSLQSPTEHLQFAPALDNEHFDVDAMWSATMENFQQCGNRGGGSPADLSPAPSSPVLGSQASAHTPSSPSSSSYVPSPPRKKKSRQQHMQEVAAFEHGEDDDDDDDDSWERNGDIGMTLCFYRLTWRSDIVWVDAAIKLADPSQWINAVDALPTLRPGIKLDGACLEFYMLWFTMEQLSSNELWFVHMQTTKECLEGHEINQTVIDDFRSSMNVTLPAAQKPIVTICHHGEHYFVAVLDYQTDSFYVLGRNIAINLGSSIGDCSDLQDWNGLNLWSQVPRLFDWDSLGSTEPSMIQTVNWRQVNVSDHASSPMDFFSPFSFLTS